MCIRDSRHAAVLLEVAYALLIGKPAVLHGTVRTEQIGQAADVYKSLLHEAVYVEIVILSLDIHLSLIHIFWGFPEALHHTCRLRSVPSAG